MGNNSLVSVIIATYNRAAYLSTAVDSVLNQTYGNLELIVVDDGSTDNTQEVLQRFRGNPRVKSIRQRNAGQGSATNLGISHARGDYIAFLDDDDAWIPQKLELQVLAIEGSDAAIIYSPLCQVDAEGNPLRVPEGPLYNGFITKQLFISNFIPYGTALVQRECFDEMGMFDPSLITGLDYDLWLRFSTRYAFGYISTPTLLYRVWPGQVTNQSERVYINGIEIMRKFLLDFPGAVDKETESYAWAHTYTGLGMTLRASEPQPWRSLLSYAEAIRHKPTHIPAWKELIKVVISESM